MFRLGLLLKIIQSHRKSTSKNLRTSRKGLWKSQGVEFVPFLKDFVFYSLSP